MIWLTWRQFRVQFLVVATAVVAAAVFLAVTGPNLLDDYHRLNTTFIDSLAYGGNPGGFVVETEAGNFYYSGDTALTLDMKLIGEAVQLQFAALCLGDNFTMGIDDAVRAADFVRCHEILGLHYDTFPPIKIDHSVAVEKFRTSGKRLHLLAPGEERDF